MIFCDKWMVIIGQASHCSTKGKDIGFNLKSSEFLISSPRYVKVLIILYVTSQMRPALIL